MSERNVFGSLGPGAKSPHVYVVVPAHNRRELTLACARALATQTYTATTIVVVDDGSTDGTAAAVREAFPAVVVLQGDGNLWWTGAVNMGVEWALARCADSDFLLTLNDDTFVEPGYAARLVETARGLPGSLVGSVLVTDDEQQIVVDGGVRVNWMTAKYRVLGAGRPLLDVQESGTRESDVDVLSGRGTLVPTEVFRCIGHYDSARLPHYAADYEFSRRAARAGYGLCVDRRAVVVSVDEPGTSGPTRSARSPLRTVMWHLGSRKSPRCVWYRIRFARLACPWYALPSYLVFDLTRVMGGSVRDAVRGSRR